MTERPRGKQPIPESATRVFEGVMFDTYQWEQEQFDGSFKTFEKLRRCDTTSVVPLLPNGNFLIAEDSQPGRDTVLTFPGGQVDKGEDPEAGALRELLEETGYRAENIELWKSAQPVTKIDWAIYTFIARDLVKVEEPKPDAGERIVLHELTFDELLLLPEDPRFQNFEIGLDLTRARYDEEKRKQLRTLLYG